MPTTPLSISTHEDTLRFLDSLDESAMKLGLSRIQKLLDTLGSPQDSLPMVHIAGTNGKGSVTAMLSSVLKSAGYSVGSFTSPHLVHVRERIGINGNPILQDDFQYEVISLKTHLEALGWPQEEWPTYFEYLNVVAYQYFKRKNVDITVFETGLGGRLDSTNVVKHPNLTVITTIGMDHMQQLGDTLAKIAAEKAGILKPGVPLVLGNTMPEEASSTILEKAKTLEIPVLTANTDCLQVDTHSSLEEGLGILNTETGVSYRLSLLGPYQRHNLALVLACIQQLRQQGFQIEESAIQDGLNHTYWPVRFQYFAAERLILDGSHNQDGFDALEETLSFYLKGQPLLWLVSLRANRPPEKLAAVIARHGAPLGIVVTQTQPTNLYHAASKLAELLKASLKTPCPIEVADTPTQAIAQLRQMQTMHAAQKPIGLVTGSLYTAGEILHCLNRG